MVSAKKENGSPLARLVLFIVCLALAGSCLAGAGYFVFELPKHASADYPPTNYGQLCTVYPNAFAVYWDLFWHPKSGCVYSEDNEGDFIIYQVCCPK